MIITKDGNVVPRLSSLNFPMRFSNQHVEFYGNYIRSVPLVVSCLYRTRLEEWIRINRVRFISDLGRKRIRLSHTDRDSHFLIAVPN